MPRKKTLPIPEPNMDKVITTGKSLKGPVIKLGGKIATPEELSSLKQEAAQFKNMLLYKVLIETIKWEAKEIIFNQAKDFQDVLNGKVMLRTIDTQENIMKLLE